MQSSGGIASRVLGAWKALAGASPMDIALTVSGRQDLRNLTREFDIDTAVMGTLDQLHELRRDARASVGGKLAPWQSATPHYPPGNMRNFISHGYRANPTVRSCIDMLMRTFNQSRFVVEDGEGNEVKGHPLVKLLQRPTNVRGMKERWKRLIQDLYLTGNALWEEVPGVGTSDTVEVWRLDPLRVALELTDQKWIVRYWYQVGGIWYPIPADSVVHWTFPDPLDPGFFGIPPLLSAASLVSVDNELVDQLKVTLQNRAVPTVVLESAPADAKLGITKVTPDKAEEARRMWRQRHGGKRQGDVAVMPNGVKANVIGMSWNEMAIGEVISVPESRIAAVHGIPMILLGRSGTQADPTRANYREAKEHFWFDTMLPLQSDVAEIITLSMLPDFKGSDGYQARFDYSDVPVLQESRLSRSQKARELFRDGLVSRHVAQRLGGLPAHGPDVFYRSSSIDKVFPADATEEDIEDEL